MKDLGLLRRYLRVQINTLLDGYFLHQENYILQLLVEVGFTYYCPSLTPLPEGTILLSDMSVEAVDSTHYSRLVGQLIYLTNTHPNISYVVGIVSRFLSAPQCPHLEAVHHILRYLRHTSNYGLLYSHFSSPAIKGFARSFGLWDLHGFIDVDWGACKETRWSVGSYLFLFAGGPISWSSKCQPIVSWSSTESEYKSLSDCCQESTHLSRLIKELKLLDSHMIPLHCSSTIVLKDLKNAPIPTR